MDRPKYQAFMKRRMELFGDTYNSDIYNLNLTDLLEKERVGRKWLEENPTHKQYERQKHRYNLIVQEIEKQQSMTVVGEVEDLL